MNVQLGRDLMSGRITTLGSLFCHKARTFHLSRKNIENVNSSKVENLVWNQITIIYMQCKSRAKGCKTKTQSSLQRERSFFFSLLLKNVESFHMKSHQNIQVGHSAFFGAGIIAL